MMKHMALTAVVLFSLLALTSTFALAGDYEFQVQNQSDKPLRFTIDGHCVHGSNSREGNVSLDSGVSSQLKLPNALIPMAPMPYNFTMVICPENSTQCFRSEFETREENAYFVDYSIGFMGTPEFEGSVNGLEKPNVYCSSEGKQAHCSIVVQ